MRIWIIVKFFAVFAVLGVVTFTAMLCYHVTVRPMGGIFEKIIPEAGSVLKAEKEEDFAKFLDSAEMPDFEPGDRAFQKAHELIALGKIADGREKLMAIVNVFPTSPSAPTARRILGQMNLDEILSSAFPTGKTNYTVKRGDSYFGIIGKNQTSLDMLMHLNGMMELKNLLAGEDLLLMPLNFRLVIEPQRNSLSLWDQAQFICDFPILKLVGSVPKSGKTQIAVRKATIHDKVVAPTSKEYGATSKSIQLKSPTLQINAIQPNDDSPDDGIYISEEDIQELFLLTIVGNEVEIRNPKK